MNKNLARSKNERRSFTFGSSCLGAGRIMSRSQAKRTFPGQDIRVALSSQGFKVKATYPAMLAEEAPQVYKPSNLVVDVVHNLGIATKVAKLVPLGVSKR
jgi:tRNA-splicing ligase RtcB